MLWESFRWKKDGGPAGLVGQEVMPAPGKDTKPWLCSELQGRWWSRSSGCTALPTTQLVRRCLRQQPSSSFSSWSSSSSHNWPLCLCTSCPWVCPCPSFAQAPPSQFPHQMQQTLRGSAWCTLEVLPFKSCWNHSDQVAGDLQQPRH